MKRFEYIQALRNGGSLTMGTLQDKRSMFIVGRTINNQRVSEAAYQEVYGTYRKCDVIEDCYITKSGRKNLHHIFSLRKRLV